jgi:serine-type D-Ala-D-Ala carboxypeptidase (penicillin-binding protein 5/6)
VNPETPAPLMVAPFGVDSLREPPPDQSPPPGQPDEPAPSGRRARRAAAKSRRRRRWRVIVPIVLVVLLLLGAGAFVGLRLREPALAPAVTPVLARTVDVPAHAGPPLPFPATGEGAVSIPSIGVVEASDAEKPVPVASLTKLMTAYVVLHDHPLAVNEPGPSATATQADVDDFALDAVSDDANAQVTLGEQITEQQLLGGLLVHSADNYADLLARWDAGSIPAFVAKMNAAAAALGMTQTHFADASGISQQSVSTAADILKVAAPDMANPVVASIVDNNSVTLPVAGTLSTYTPLLGLDGIIGVKSGYTDAAGGCDVVAVIRPVHGHRTLLLAAVTGQAGALALAQAGLHGLALVNAVQPLIGTSKMLGDGAVAAQVGAAGSSAAARTSASVSMLTWPGVYATRVFRPMPRLSAHAKRGALVGHVVVTLGTQRVVVPVHLARDLPQRSWLQRIF